jgi:hypothetical protein
MDFFHTTATGRALRDGTRNTFKYALPIFGAIYLAQAIISMMGGPCLLDGSVACRFGNW